MKQLEDNELYCFIGWQEFPGHPPVGLYNLKQDVEGHPKGSTLSDATIIELGLHKMESSNGCFKALEAELVEARRAMRTWDEAARADKAEIDRLKAEMEKRLDLIEKWRGEAENALKDRDLWKSKAEKLVDFGAKANLAYRLKKGIEENAIAQNNLAKAIAEFTKGV